jgi:hypothetical protein
LRTKKSAFWEWSFAGQDLIVWTSARYHFAAMDMAFAVGNNEEDFRRIA